MPIFIRSCSAMLAFLFAALGLNLAQADTISLSENYRNEALGMQALYLVEKDAPLALEQAQAAHAAGAFVAANSAVLNFGMGARPVWVLLSVNNPLSEPVGRRLLIETAWLDHLEIYFVASDSSTDPYRLGDEQLFNDRPIRSRFFAVDHNFDAGNTDIYIRVATPDPMVLPIYLLTADDANERERNEGYSYGFIYGYLAALLAYNIVLFFSLRDRRHLQYANFLGLFIALNGAYTGHGFFWIWPNDVVVQRWIIPILMVLCGCGGFAFAKSFLKTKTNLPRVHRFVAWSARLSLVLLLAAVVFGKDQFYALLVAFAFSALFSVSMLWMGVLSVYSGQRFSRYFLFASIASMAGTALTTLSVWGLIPYAEWKFRSAEVGMLIDATLLALALGKQFRAIQLDGILAERRAARDPLTDLYNRRSFMETAETLWSTALRDERELTLIMLDLDHFKTINDVHGHGLGDAALIATANVLAGAVRAGDIVARWGGEEFLLMLPGSGLDAAVALAERLRRAVAEIHLASGNGDIALTASIGVACRIGHRSLESLITDVDRFLYQAKKEGRNRVSSAIGAPRILNATS